MLENTNDLKPDFSSVAHTFATSNNFATSLANTTPISSSSGAFFTPNTLLRIEQTLLDLESKTPVSQNAPAMVIKPESDYDNCSNISGSDLESHDSRSLHGDRSGKFHIPEIDPQTYLVANSRRPTGPRRNKTSEMLSQEEETKRTQRRDRNKVAAAKCRKRREDHAQILINETEQLEDDKSSLETEISNLQQQKEQLEFLLQAHQHNCQRNKRVRVAAPSPMPRLMPAPQNIPTPSFRPTSLALSTHTPINTTSLTEATGISVETPSNGMLSLYSMVDGHSGLTPLSGVIPSTPSTTLDTPTIGSKDRTPFADM